MPALSVGSHEQSRSIGQATQRGGGSDVIRSSATPDERLGWVPVSEGESRHQRRSPLRRSTRFDGGAKIQQGFYERDLHAGLRQMTARYQHAHRRVMPAVHLGQRVNFGAGMEQGFRDINGAFRGLLAVALDAFGGD